jgi:hypothetical protein
MIFSHSNIKPSFDAPAGAALPQPPWHQEILEKREAQITAGTAQFTDWEVAKQEILATTLTAHKHRGR